MFYGVLKQQLKHLSKDEYLALREMCYISKNMYNVALYSVRQEFFDLHKYVNYYENYHLCKNNENYKLLNANAAQEIMKVVDANFKSFFSLLKLKQQGQYNEKVHIPHYLPKDGFANLIFTNFKIKNNKFIVPMSPTFKKQYGKVTISVPSNLNDRHIKQIKIVPKCNARFFEIQYTYEVEPSQIILNTNHVLAIDLGVDNLCSCVTSNGKAFIINGKKLKSTNQYANKVNSKLQSIKDKQHIKGTTKRQARLWLKRDHQVNDYMNKTVHTIIGYCLVNNIGTIVIGYNTNIQKNSHIGKINNQNFVNIPIGQLRSKLKQKCKIYNITYIEQEESYTSKADFFANDKIPIYDPNNNVKHTFSGKRIHRGLYKSGTGITLNADINGALNILRKSNVIQNFSLAYVQQPIRLKVV